MVTTGPQFVTVLKERGAPTVIIDNVIGDRICQQARELKNRNDPKN